MIDKIGMHLERVTKMKTQIINIRMKEGISLQILQLLKE